MDWFFINKVTFKINQTKPRRKQLNRILYRLSSRLTENSQTALDAAPYKMFTV